jgi:hypothetical protein
MFLCCFERGETEGKDDDGANTDTMGCVLAKIGIPYHISDQTPFAQKNSRNWHPFLPCTYCLGSCGPSISSHSVAWYQHITIPVSIFIGSKHDASGVPAFTREQCNYNRGGIRRSMHHYSHSHSTGMTDPHDLESTFVSGVDHGHQDDIVVA